MELSGASAGNANLATAVQVAVQQQMLTAMKQQGAGVVQMLAGSPTGSANSASQGNFVDALA